MKRKAQLYVDWGSDFVWIIDPVAATALTYTEGLWKTIAASESLAAGPGFSIALQLLLS